MIKHIAHLVSTFPPYTGGMGNVAYAYATHLAQRGKDVTVLTPTYPEQVKMDFPFAVRYLQPTLTYGNAAFLPGVAAQLTSFDLIHLHYPFFGAVEGIPLWKKRYPGIPLVTTYHMDALAPWPKGGIFSLHRQLFQKAVLKASDRILVSSFDYARHSFLAAYFHRHPEKFVEMPFGVGEEFSPGTPDTKVLVRHNPEGKNLSVFFVGGLDKAHAFKGLEVLLKAWKEVAIPHARLLIGGKGDRREVYQALANHLGISDRVEFLGYIPQEHLVDYYRLADIVVYPSLSASEAFGLVNIEAGACQKPVISSNIPGVRSVVEDQKTGLLVPPDNIKALSQALTTLLSDAALRQRLGQAAEEKVNTAYRWPALIDKLEAIYEDCSHQ